MAASRAAPRAVTVVPVERSRACQFDHVQEEPAGLRQDAHQEQPRSRCLQCRAEGGLFDVYLVDQ